MPNPAAYMIGDIWTDSGFLTGIGGCPTQNLAAQFASTTRTYFYQFDDLHAPGLNNDHPGYQWGAGPIRRRPRRVAATCLPPAPSRAGARPSSRRIALIRSMFTLYA